MGPHVAVEHENPADSLAAEALTVTGSRNSSVSDRIRSLFSYQKAGGCDRPSLRRVSPVATSRLGFSSSVCPALADTS